ncbi:ABC transporter [Sandaracinobacter neustonicus]|uniref:ABC transporter n=1 Tax=Sandaracinobacter neustonicus TaxID=1715348 RepID=A0A501XPD9_9SPHN|nr:ABC-type transport auxiliary lipoprotein family protein [Sandaracinobacter neustonicus]TPE62305.1 ABC transporter [Sandaracinobacter neustonicus]
MTRATRPVSRLPLALLPLILLPLIPLSACGPLVEIGGNTPRPDAVYTLSAAPPTAVPAGLTPIDLTKAVSVDTPTVPGALQTLRIPVIVSDTAIQYVQGAQWSEQPNRLFQRLLADLLVQSGRAVIDPGSSGQTAGRRLTGQLQAFGVDVRGSNKVTVRYDATLAGPGGIRQRRFEREAELSAVQGPQVAEALNGVANLIAADVAAWIASAP